MATRPDAPARVEGSWVLGADGRTADISPAAAAMLGCAPGDLLGRSPFDLVDPRDEERLRDALARRATGCRESYELRWRHRTGGTVWTLISAAPMVGADGGHAGSFGLVTDITAQRCRDSALARQTRQQEAVAAIGRRALEETDLERVVEHAARIVADVLRADDAAVRRELADERLAAGEPIVVRDWRDERHGLRPADLGAASGARSTLAVPIRSRVLHGALTVSRRCPWQPQDDELRFVESVANVLAGAILRDEAEDAGRRRALHDVLTGLPNRTLALDRLDHALRRGREEDDAGPVAVLLVDVDRFNRVNETYGARGGDEVVRTVAERLCATTGPADTVARLAGDAFVVLCEDLPDEAAAGPIAGRIVEALRAPMTVAGEETALTASVGVALSCGTSGGAAELLRDAERALERAKDRGRDRFELFEETLRAAALDRLQLERDLHRALERDQLFVVHQPIVAVGGGQVIGTEALVRWRHPERGIVPPGDFIALAEESGLIADIGLWVLRRACADVADRHRRGRLLTCHVNLSPVQADDPELPARVAEALEESGLPPESLVLELTEGLLMDAGDGPLRVLQRIRALGVRLVLDDFGTGYSSLGRLRHFPVDGLKIDRSFVGGLTEDCDPSEALIVSGMVELARALGLTVVAEGVETAHQLERLGRIGCRYAQGFHLARPGDLAALDRLLV